MPFCSLGCCNQSRRLEIIGTGRSSIPTSHISLAVERCHYRYRSEPTLYTQRCQATHSSQAFVWWQERFNSTLEYKCRYTIWIDHHDPALNLMTHQRHPAVYASSSLKRVQHELLHMTGDPNEDEGCWERVDVEADRWKVHQMRLFAPRLNSKDEMVRSLVCS